MIDQTTQTAQDAKRAGMIAKIRALRAKTEQAGASEAEAMSAAEKAAELMDAYEVTEDDLAEMRGKAFEWSKGRTDMANRTQDHKVFFCTGRIAALTGTKIVYRRLGEMRTCEYFGEPADVQLAVWLHDTIRSALDREYTSYRQARRTVGQGAKGSFQLGMCGRLNDRMREIIRSRQPTPSDTSRALVVVKQAIVQAAFDEAYPRLRASRPKRLGFDLNGSAFGAGQAAGDRVGLDRPVGSGAAGALRIGSRG